MKKKKQTVKTDTKFGIPKEKYERAEKAASLQNIYDFGDELGEIAFYLAGRFGITLEQAFELVWRCMGKKEDHNI